MLGVFRIFTAGVELEAWKHRRCFRLSQKRGNNGKGVGTKAKTPIPTPNYLESFFTLRILSGHAQRLSVRASILVLRHGLSIFWCYRPGADI